MSNIYPIISNQQFLEQTQFVFYVYAYLRKQDKTPYYIGKGQENRAYEKHKGISVPKDRSQIVFMETNLSEIGAFALERRYIRWYGRKDHGTGILLNKTDGGDGIFGFVHSIETKTKISTSHKGKKMSSKARANMSIAQTGKKRKPFSLKHRAALSASKKGIKMSSESITKNSESHKGKKLSAETRQKISTSLMGKNKGRIHTLESRHNMSVAHKGHKQSQETKKKISENHVGMRGKRHTAESRLQMSKSAKKRWVKGDN